MRSSWAAALPGWSRRPSSPMPARRSIILEQEGENSLGGQAFWSLGGLFFVDSPEQRRMRIRDSRALALQDWMGSAQFDGPQDHWPRKVAEAFVDFAAGEMRPWLHAMGMRWFPVVGWAERGGGLAHGHGNSVPRFHLTWGTGPGVLEPFVRRVREHAARGLVALKFRHQASRLITHQRRRHRRRRRRAGAVDGRSAASSPAAPSSASSNSTPARSSSPRAASAATTIWCARTGRPSGLGPAPKKMVAGVPHHVDGRMIAIAQDGRRCRDQRRPHVALHRGRDELGADLAEPRHPHPARPVLAVVRRQRASGCEAPFLPGFDTLGTLQAASCRPATSIPGSC